MTIKDVNYLNVLPNLRKIKTSYRLPLFTEDTYNKFFEKSKKSVIFSETELDSLVIYDKFCNKFKKLLIENELDIDTYSNIRNRLIMLDKRLLKTLDSEILNNLNIFYLDKLSNINSQIRKFVYSCFALINENSHFLESINYSFFLSENSFMTTVYSSYDEIFIENNEDLQELEVCKKLRALIPSYLMDNYNRAILNIHREKDVYKDYQCNRIARRKNIDALEKTKLRDYRVHI